MANPSNVYIVAVETVAILSLTLISLMGMYKGQNEIAAAAVGGIAGFISHKSLSKASSESEKPSAEAEKAAKTTTEQPEPKLESEYGLQTEIKPKTENKEKILEEESEIEEDVA